MRDDAGGGDEQTPEVTAAPAPEGDKAQHHELDSIVPGDGGERSKDVCAVWVLRDGVVANQRFRDIEGTGGRHGRLEDIAW